MSSINLYQSRMAIKNANKPRILLVVQRYGLEVNGGAELHCRWIAEHLTQNFDLEIHTTRALDYISWKNHYKKGREIINGIPVYRHSVKRERNLDSFGQLQNKIFYSEHDIEDEKTWVEANGPISPALLKAIKKQWKNASAILFWSYRYWPSFHGVNIYPEKSIIVTTAERDRLIDLPLFTEELNKPAGIIYLTPEEKELVNSRTNNENIPSLVSACGIDPLKNSTSFKKKNKISAPYLLYVGRIDRNKGCRQMFDFFRTYKEQRNGDLKLILMGKTAMKIPDDANIINLGFVDEETKWSALYDAEALIMPSFFESLSIILLEAWAAGCPAVVNGQCEVLEGQCKRSNAGLYYTNYPEFQKSLDLVINEKKMRQKLSENGRNFIAKYYNWEKVTADYSDFINEIISGRGAQ